MQQVGLRVVLQRYLEASQPAAERERGPGQVAGPPGGRRLAGRAQQHLPGRGDVAGELQYLTKLHGDGDRLGRPASAGVMRRRVLEAEAGGRVAGGSQRPGSDLLAGLRADGAGPVVREPGGRGGRAGPPLKRPAGRRVQFAAPCT